MIVRKALETDAPQVLAMATKFYQETPYAAEIPFDPGSCYELFLRSLEQNLCFIAEDGAGIIRGFVIGLAFPSVMNKNYLMGAELAWYVDQDYRGTIGYRLLKEIEKSAEEIGVKGWSMIALESHDAEKVGNMYVKAGYKPTEHTFSRFY